MHDGGQLDAQHDGARFGYQSASDTPVGLEPMPYRRLIDEKNILIVEFLIL